MAASKHPEDSLKPGGPCQVQLMRYLEQQHLRSGVAGMPPQGARQQTFHGMCSDGRPNRDPRGSHKVCDYVYSRQAAVVQELGEEHSGTGSSTDFALARYKVSSSLEERLYATTDANHNVTSIDDVFGAVKERFVYDPYRNSTVLTSAFASTSDAYGFIVRSQGQREDATTNTIDSRNRVYGLGIGRWMQADNIGGYVDGANRYQFVLSTPISRVDPHGQQAIRIDADAFIPNDWVPVPGIGDLKGDNREISFLPLPSDKSRIASWIEVELDGTKSNPEINHGATLTESTLRTSYWTGGTDFSGDGATEHIDYDKAVGGGDYSFETKRLSPCIVWVHMKQSGHVPRKFVPIAPDIDYNYYITLKRNQDGHITYWVVGDHDGFPAYELYIDGTLVHSYDPRISGTGPSALWGTSDEKANETGSVGD